LRIFQTFCYIYEKRETEHGGVEWNVCTQINYGKQPSQSNKYIATANSPMKIDHPHFNRPANSFNVVCYNKQTKFIRIRTITRHMGVSTRACRRPSTSVLR